jgi:MFS family permease
MALADFRSSLVKRISKKFFYGWVMLGIGALGMFASGPGQSHTFSVFVGPIGKELGLSGTTIASAYGFATLIAAFCLPLMGRMVDRHGARNMMTIISILLGCACFAFGAATGIIWLAIGFASLRFMAQGSLMMGCVTVVSQWFVKKRGFAMSLMGLGFALSMAVHPPLAQWLIDMVGWRQSWVILGLISWLLLIIPILFLVVNKPEDVDLLPDGKTSKAQKNDENMNSSNLITGFTIKEALQTPAFYIISAGMGILSMLVTSLHFFQVSIFSNQGLDAHVASMAFPISAMTMVFCMPIIGKMLDRFSTHWIFSGGLLIMASSLISITFVHDLPTALIYAICFGINNAITMTFFSYMYANYFGRKHVGSVQGTGQMIGVIGASLGPLPLGYALDTFGSFQPMLLGLAGLPIAMAVIVLFLRAPKIPAS